jgi:hypothetical protein
VLANYLSYQLLDDVNFKRMQYTLNSHAPPLTARRALESVLARFFVNVKQEKARQLDTGWPISVLADGCSRKNGVRFEAIMGRFICKVLKR